MEKERRDLLSRPIFDSRIHSANTERKEKALGFFTGPMLVYMVYYAVAGTYLTQFYTDVLGIAGVFLTLMPIFSKVVDAITNIVMGRVIDKTRSRQGKATVIDKVSALFFPRSQRMCYLQLLRKQSTRESTQMICRMFAI